MIRQLLDQRYQTILRRYGARVQSQPRDDAGRPQGYVICEVGGVSGIRVLTPPDQTYYPGDYLLVEQHGTASAAQYVALGLESGRRPGAGSLEISEPISFGDTECAPGDLVWGNPTGPHFHMRYDYGRIELKSGSVVTGRIDAETGAFIAGRPEGAHSLFDSSGMLIKVGNIQYAGLTGGSFWVGPVGAQQRLSYTASTGVLEVTGKIIAREGELNNLDVKGTLNVFTSGVLKSGATGYNTGTGWWLDYNSGTPRVYVGNTSAGKYLRWNGTDLELSGNVTLLNQSSIPVSGFANDLGWTGENLIANGNMEAGSRNWSTWTLVTDPAQAYEGQRCVSFTGSGGVTKLADFYVPVNVGETYSAAAFVRGTAPVMILIGFDYYTANYIKISRSNAFRYDNSWNTTLFETTNPTANTVKIVPPAKDWASIPNPCIQFRIQNDYSDLPNFTTRYITNIDKSNPNYWLLTTAEAIGNTYNAGETVALSQAGNTFAYCLGILNAPSTWTRRSAIISGVNGVNEFPSDNQFWIGTKYVRPVYVVNFSQSATVYADDWSLYRVDQATQNAATTATNYFDSTGKLIGTQNPSGSGLFINSQYMGYYDGSTWRAYISNTGLLYLYHAGNKIALDASVPVFRLGDAVSYNSGTGIWMGKHENLYKFRVGDPQNQYITWNGTQLIVKGRIEAIDGSINFYSTQGGQLSIGEIQQIVGGQLQGTGIHAIRLYDARGVPQISMTTGDIDMPGVPYFSVGGADSAQYIRFQDGQVQISGWLNATGGSISGFNISGNYLQTADGSFRIQAYADNYLAKGIHMRVAPVENDISVIHWLKPGTNSPVSVITTWLTEDGPQMWLQASGIPYGMNSSVVLAASNQYGITKIKLSPSEFDVSEVAYLKANTLYLQNVLVNDGQVPHYFTFGPTALSQYTWSGLVSRLTNYNNDSAGPTAQFMINNQPAYISLDAMTALYGSDIYLSDLWLYFSKTEAGPYFSSIRLIQLTPFAYNGVYHSVVATWTNIGQGLPIGVHMQFLTLPSPRQMGTYILELTPTNMTSAGSLRFITLLVKLR